MYNNKSFLAVIPARGGSKRLIRKNMLNLVDKPLVAWTINAALKSKYIDKVVVSTDEKEIAQIAEQYGAEVPFMRPAKLSTDEASSVSVILHTMDFLRDKGNNYDYVVMLQPTSPLRTTDNIDEAIEQLQQHNDAIISVCQAEHHPLWCNTLDASRSMSGFLRSDVVDKRSQDLEKFYRLNGAIYICKSKTLRNNNTFFLKDRISAYIMDQENSIDIDTQIDFNLAILTLEKKIPKKI